MTVIAITQHRDRIDRAIAEAHNEARYAVWQADTNWLRSIRGP